MKLSEAAGKVIALAEAIRTYWDRELPKRHPRYPLVQPGEDSGPPPPEEAELANFVARLPADDLYKLSLIMHLGRGDIGVDHLADHYRELRSTLRKPEAASQIVGNAPVGEYLADGLAELNRSGIDLDHLNLASSVN